MLEETKNIIIKQFVTLMKECDVNVLKELLINKGVFTAGEINNIFSTADSRHNKRLFFFSIQEKEQTAFNTLIDCLKETNQHKIAQLLLPGHSACKPFCFPPEDEDSLLDVIPVHEDSNQSPLSIRVVQSNQFYDTVAHNRTIHFYPSRSKKRGRVLLINNYDYNGKRLYRNGALVDNANLHELFTQMGGWDINPYENKTSEEMLTLVTQFAQDTRNNQYDICFVIMMGHGGEEFHNTCIYGVDDNNVFVNAIEDQFTDEKCHGFRGKPKLLLFQLCRGGVLDHTIAHTETDSAPMKRNPTSVNTSQLQTGINSSVQEDILIGYPTLIGFMSHRDFERGSWYIELICKHFMNYAHIYPVDELLQLVDQGLRIRMSEIHTMQTSEICNKGFKRLYLNPGIYEEDGEMKYFSG